MVSKDKVIEITNRSRGSLGFYTEVNGHRNIQAGETVEITMDELRKLSFQPGGMSIIENNLIIRDKEAIEEILGEVEPEYTYGEEEIKNLLLYGTLDQLKDCLDFAPTGVIDLVKKLAVDLRINDIAKRKAIETATGFDVNSAVAINEASAEDDNAETEVKTRRTSTVINTPSTTTEDTKTRRTTNYKIVK